MYFRTPHPGDKDLHMKNREQYKRILNFLASALLLLAQTALFAFVWFHSYTNTGANYFVRGNYIVIAQYALMVFFFNKIYGGFRVGQLRMFEVLFSQCLSIVCVNVITYLQLSLIGRWKFLSNLRPILLMTLFDLIFTCIWVALTRLAYVRLYPPRKLLVVYDRYTPDLLVRKLDTRRDKYAVQEIIPISAGVEQIRTRILAYPSVILADIPSEIRNELLKFCFKHDIRCYTVPKISDIMIMSASSIHLFDTSLLLCRNMGMTAEQRFFKRLFDIAASLIAIVLASPVMLLIALAIWLYDRGPVLFTQDRLTKDSHVFRLLKFRSMRVAPADNPYCLTRKNDSRVTPVGKIIRSIHFDELPQLFNILRGDMSFVGPRPECPDLAADYRAIIPEFDYRLKVKAGLTGFAQVYGKYNTTPYDKLKLDLTYIENYSFLLDMKLMLLTAKVLFQRENTEGIEQDQTSAVPADGGNVPGGRS